MSRAEIETKLMEVAHRIAAMGHQPPEGTLTPEAKAALDEQAELLRAYYGQPPIAPETPDGEDPARRARIVSLAREIYLRRLARESAEDFRTLPDAAPADFDSSSEIARVSLMCAEDFEVAFDVWTEERNKP